MYVMRMPQVGMGMTEADVVEWMLGEGEEVAEGDDIVEIEMAKASTMLQAPVSGVILKIVAGDGTTVGVGEPIAVIGERGESLPAGFAAP